MTTAQVFSTNYIDFSDKNVVGVVSVNSIDFVRTIFNCFDNNQVAVFLRDATDTYKIQVTGASQIITPAPEFGWCDLTFTPKPAEALAQIAFTSGTTGQPKGVLLRHGALNDVVDRLNHIMEVDASIREYVGVPTNYSFGFGRCRAVATAGGQFYIPEHGFNPLEIRDLLVDGAINAISAVPSLWRILFQCADIFGSETQAVRWIEIGSQYMSRSEKEQLRQLFPAAKIVQHYGLTEASRSTFLRIDQTDGEHLESVGKAYGQTEIKLSSDDKIMIRGPHVAQQLIIDSQIQTNIDADGWLETSDLGLIKDGYVYYQGRADDLINCGGIKLSPDDIEKLIREELNIQSGIAIARVSDAMRGDAVLVGTLASANLNQDAVKQAAIRALAQRNVYSPDAVKLMGFEQFPATATGKIQRKQLAQLYTMKLETLQQERELAAQSAPDSSDSALTQSQRDIVSAWQSVLGIDHIDIDSNFFELGGDSLTAISVMVRMEKLGISQQIARGMLQGLSVRSLAERMDNTHTPEAYQTHTISNQHVKAGININIVRGILVACVIMAHWSDAFFAIAPAFMSGLKPLLSPIFTAGTPGFTIIYGVSAGYSLFTIFKTDPQRLNKILRATTGLLCGGILVLAALDTISQFSVQGIQSWTDFTNTFYSVLTYYFLISLTLPLWFRLISRFQHPAVVSGVIAMVLYCSYYYVFEPISAYNATGFLELGKLMISAKYSYVNLTAGVLGGLSIGLIIRDRVENRSSIPANFAWIGIGLVSAGLVISSHAGHADEWLQWPLFRIFIWGWLFYLGAVLMLLSLFNRVLNSYNHLAALPKTGLQFLATLGILAFPAFVTHEMVIPLKMILERLGLSEGIAILIALGLFVGGFTVMYRKIHAANFTWS